MCDATMHRVRVMHKQCIMFTAANQLSVGEPWPYSLLGDFSSSSLSPLPLSALPIAMTGMHLLQKMVTGRVGRNRQTAMD